VSVTRQQAYVIKTFTINEADTVAVLLTESGEKKSAIAKNGARLKSTVAGKLEPFNFVEVELFEKENQKLHPVNQVSVIKSSLQDISGDMTRFFVFSLLSEIVDRTVHGAEGNGKLYRLVGHVMDGMRNGVPPAHAVAYFMFWKLRLDGVIALPETCPGCGVKLGGEDAIHSAGGRFTCSSCGSGRELSPDAYRLMKAMEGKPLTGIDAPPAAWRPVLSLVQEQLQHHLGGPLKALQLLLPMLT